MDAGAERTLGSPIHRNLLDDVRDFVARRPAIPTHVRAASPEQRDDFARRILERVEIPVAHYAILNIHRIGVDAPVPFVFEQFRTWEPRSVWWPNRIARLAAADRELRDIRVYFLGRRKPFLGLKIPFFGLNVVPLFSMQVLNVRDGPATGGIEPPRYTVYRCGGGYPVGVVIVYVRPPFPDSREREPSQVFFVVGFNFYGREDWPRRHLVNAVWERIHNRVTGNVLNRFKLECEARLARAQATAVAPRRLSAGPVQAGCRATDPGDR